MTMFIGATNINTDHDSMYLTTGSQIGPVLQVY